MSQKNALTVIVAPSCAGKDYLSKCLLSEFPNKFEMVVTSTTREPRQGEMNGKDYWFMPKDEFENSITKGEFLEHVRFGNNLYGTSSKAISTILNKNKFPILIVEPVGAINIWNWCYENKQPSQFVYIDIDRRVALSRFIDRFIKDYEKLNSNYSEYSVAPEKNDFNSDLERLINSYSNRIFLSMYKENEWSKVLPYQIKIGPLLKHNDSVEASRYIKNEVLKKISPPSFSLNKSINLNDSDNPKLHDMRHVIKNTLSLVKKSTVDGRYFQNVILKCEHEKLNQIELSI